MPRRERAAFGAFQLASSTAIFGRKTCAACGGGPGLPQASVPRNVPAAGLFLLSSGPAIRQGTRGQGVLYDGGVPTAWRSKTKITIVRSRQLSQFPWLVHGFSTRVGGFSRVYSRDDLNLGFTPDDSRATVEKNRAAFLRELGAATRRRGSKKAIETPWPLVTLRQVHSDIIHRVDSVPAEQTVGDGLITATPGLLLGVQTADCIPVIVVDTRRHAVGVFHAGWRGTVKRIVEKGAGEMVRHFGSRPRDLKAAIGPGISGCCYEVGEEVRTEFESQFAYAASLFREVKESDPVREKYPLLFLTARAPGHSVLPNKIFLDLVEANRQQLMAAGVPKKNIESSALCTNCHPELLFSYRAEKGKTGRLMGVAGVRGTNPNRTATARSSS